MNQKQPNLPPLFPRSVKTYQTSGSRMKRPVVIETPDGTRYHIGKISNEIMRGEDVIVLYGVGEGVKP